VVDILIANGHLNQILLTSLLVVVDDPALRRISTRSTLPVDAAIIRAELPFCEVIDDR
jgi:hypothetical protein